MRMRRLPEIDLARVAPRPTNEKRTELEHFKLGHPKITYKHVRALFSDIFNVRPNFFTEDSPTPWQVIENLISVRTKSEEEREANLLVAKGLYAFTHASGIRSRSQDFFPLPLSAGERVTYWLPMVTVLNDMPTVLFIDPRRSKRLTTEARRFVFSVMHEHIRISNPDFAAASLGIIQFGDAIEGKRPVKLWTDEGLDFYSFDELDEMVSETYSIWKEISEEREAEVRRKASGGFGPLFEN